MGPSKQKEAKKTNYNGGKQVIRPQQMNNVTLTESINLKFNTLCKCYMLYVLT